MGLQGLAAHLYHHVFLVLGSLNFKSITPKKDALIRIWFLGFWDGLGCI